MKILQTSYQIYRLLAFNQAVPSSCYQCRRFNSNGMVDVTGVSHGIAWVKMNKTPVNSMDGNLLEKLEAAFDKLENDDHCRGVILTSSLPNVFSAGLDIPLLLHSDRTDEFDKMWEGLQNLWLRMYCSPLTVVAAINGSAPAGGCMITLACDYRIMAHGAHYIGISAPRLGIMPPPWVQTALKNTIGHRRTEEALGKAKMYSVDEALKLGLIDRAVKPELLEVTALEEMDKMLAVPDHARILSKQLMRLKDIQYLRDNQKNDLEFYQNHVMGEETQTIIKKYLHDLKQRKKSSYIY
ncbi:enoyl-CoA delta isomerase 1, mitochondrial-like isoform X1 [Amphiura filiformis]|uniref:enoyl-CoA delta isomerase 1, mitochondrial-like isoform X1 n=1 Tax=Amphiura filiformis TaxID=82378 RepID=UPI003B2232DB